MRTTPSLRTRLGIGAAAVLAAGAMATVGVSSASATPSSPSPSATSTIAPTGATTAVHSNRHGLGIFLRIKANSPQAAGDRAAKAATALINHPRLLAKLPADLQTDVKALANAAPADRVKDAYKIKTTALSGGYGANVQKRAEHLVKNTTAAAGLRKELRLAFNSANPGAGMQKFADQLISHPKLFAELPAKLRADLKTLKAAPSADLDTQANTIKDTALNGGYGTKVQKIAQAPARKATNTPHA